MLLCTLHAEVHILAVIHGPAHQINGRENAQTKAAADISMEKNDKTLKCL